MPDIKFSCPHCQQHISADSGYIGMQINCPACAGSLVVEGAPTPTPVLSQSPAPVTVQRPTPNAAASGCPSCGAGLPRGAVLCTQCGYNISTGQRTVAGRPAALGKPTAPKFDAPWYKTPWPYVGGVVLLLGVLYFFGKTNPAVMLGFLATAVIYCLIVHIIVIIAAFQESSGTGFLTMCLPFYALYFVFKVHDSDTLKVLYGFAILINIALRFLGASL